MPIHVSAYLEQTRIVPSLVTNGVPVDAVDHLRKTPLYYAISGRQYEVAKFLLLKNADVNICNATREQDSPLHMAALLGDVKLIKLLIRNRACWKLLLVTENLLYFMQLKVATMKL